MHYAREVVFTHSTLEYYIYFMTLCRSFNLGIEKNLHRLCRDDDGDL